MLPRRISAEQRDSMARWLIATDRDPRPAIGPHGIASIARYGERSSDRVWPNINERNALSDALRGIYPTPRGRSTAISTVSRASSCSTRRCGPTRYPPPRHKRDHISEPRKPLPQPEAETLATLTAPESPAPITTPFTTESDIPLPTFDPPARTLPDNVRDAVDQHPDAARFVVNGLEKSPDGGAVPCKALRACMDKYLGRSCTLQEVAAMEAIAGFQYGMTYENRFGSDVFANVQIVPVVALEPSPPAPISDSDAPSPQNRERPDPDLIDLGRTGLHRRYIAVEQRNYLATAHETAKETVREMEEPLRQEFIERGTQSVNRHGWSVHMRRDLWARVLGEDRDKAYAALRALPEWRHLVTETVNAQSLKSTVRSLQESRGLAKGASDEELAAGILPASLRAHIGLGRQTTIRATRSRKES